MVNEGFFQNIRRDYESDTTSSGDENFHTDIVQINPPARTLLWARLRKRITNSADNIIPRQLHTYVTPAPAQEVLLDLPQAIHHPPQAPVSTVVLEIRLHCDGCITRIRKIISKYEGVDTVDIDAQKDLVTVKGTMDVKALEPYLKIKLRRSVYVVPPKKEEGEKKGVGDKNAKCGDGGGEKAKGGDGGGEKKGVDGGAKVDANKMKYYGNGFGYGGYEYPHPNYILIPNPSPNGYSVNVHAKGGDGGSKNKGVDGGAKVDANEMEYFGNGFRYGGYEYPHPNHNLIPNPNGYSVYVHAKGGDGGGEKKGVDGGAKVNANEMEYFPGYGNGFGYGGYEYPHPNHILIPNPNGYSVYVHAKGGDGGGEKKGVDGGAKVDAKEMEYYGNGFRYGGYEYPHPNHNLIPNPTGYSVYVHTKGGDGGGEKKGVDGGAKVDANEMEYIPGYGNGFGYGGYEYPHPNYILIPNPNGYSVYVHAPDFFIEENPDNCSTT